MIHFVVLVGLLLIWLATLSIQRSSGRGAAVWDNNYSWFVIVWIGQFVLLLLPIFDYFEPVSWATALYILGAHLAFASGTVFVCLRHSPSLRAQPNLTLLYSLRKLLGPIMLMGLGAQIILTLNSLLGSGLSLGARLNPDTLVQVRLSNFQFEPYFLGPLFGPMSILAALCYVALPWYFFAWGLRVRWARRFSIETLTTIGIFFTIAVSQVLVSGGRIAIVFLIGLAIIPILLARSLRRRLGQQPRPVPKALIAVAIIGLTFGSALFQQLRGNRVEPLHILRASHGANVASPLLTAAQENSFLGYYLLQTSYLSTPPHMLGLYLDLPDEKLPGPFYGTYNFQAVYRNLFRIMPSFDPQFWDKARYELFLPVLQLGREGNIWSTLLRDLIGDFGTVGTLVFLFFAGFFSQQLSDSFRRRPSGAKAALLSILKLIFLFSALFSLFFLAWTAWAILVLLGKIALDAYRIKISARVLDRRRRFQPSIRQTQR